MLNRYFKSGEWMFLLLFVAGMVLLFLFQTYLSEYPFYPHQFYGGFLFGVPVVVLIYRIRSGQIQNAVFVKAKRKWIIRDFWMPGLWLFFLGDNHFSGRSHFGFIYAVFLFSSLFVFFWSFFFRGIYFHENKFSAFSYGFYTMKANTISVVEEHPDCFEFFQKAFRGSTKVRKSDYADADWEKVVYLMKEWCVRNEVVMR